MTRSRLALLLLLAALTVGCETSSAVPNSPKPAPAAEVAPRVTALKVVAPEPSEPAEPTIPPVCLSTLHAKWCVSKVSDPFPAIELPRLGGPRTKLATLYGKQATVVLFWTGDRWMSRMALEDLVHEVATVYEPKQVAVAGIAVGQSTNAARRRLSEANAEFPQLLDADGSALAEVGSVALPRIYVLDSAGKIVWFDIEYSESTRRELEQSLGVLTATGEEGR